jgi:hypothetical protein
VFAHSVEKKSKYIQVVKLKIRLRIEKGKKIIEIPFTDNEIRDLYEVGYIPSFENIKDNKLKDFPSAHHKLTFIVHDILDNGGVWIPDKNGKYRLKYGQWLVKKPRWKQ